MNNPTTVPTIPTPIRRDPDLSTWSNSRNYWILCETCAVLMRVTGRMHHHGSKSTNDYKVSYNWPNHCERCEETAWTLEEWDAAVNPPELPDGADYTTDTQRLRLQIILDRRHAQHDAGTLRPAVRRRDTHQQEDTV